MSKGGIIIRAGAAVILCLVAIAVSVWLSRSVVVTEIAQPTFAPVVVQKEIEPTSPPAYVKASDASRITGLPCAQHDKRSFAIMYSGDVETRPYFSGTGVASFVVEMDHRYTHGGTRVMGVFDCEKPQFVGPMRSGRVDFLNVAASFDAVYVPWGGDSTSKGLLKKGVHDHIDCNGEVYPGGSPASCFRRDTATVPLGKEDRAFSSAVSLQAQAESLGYRMATNFAGFSHRGDSMITERPSSGTLNIGLQKGFDVRYDYNREDNTYERFFAGREEYDFDTKKRVAPKNVIVIVTSKGTFSASGDYAARGLINPWLGVDATHQRNDVGQYPNFALGDAWFDTVFSGEARFYHDGQEVIGSWKKEKGVNKPFEFFDAVGQELKFVPGQIWMHVVDTDRMVTWKVVL